MRSKHQRKNESIGTFLKRNCIFIYVNYDLYLLNNSEQLAKKLNANFTEIKVDLEGFALSNSDSLEPSALTCNVTYLVLKFSIFY